jgi:hypothetical protein
MATTTLRFQRLGDRADRLDLGGKLLAVAGVAVFVYGIAFLITNFTSFVEVGLSRGLVGGDAGSIQAFSPALYRYLSHLQVNFSAFVMGFGIMIAVTGWHGVREGRRWALWSVLGSYFLGLAVGLPIHYAYGLATLVHVGPFYAVTLLVLIGGALAYSGMPREAVKEELV